MTTTTVRVHPAARDLLLLAIDAGWSSSLVHACDGSDNPYVTVTARRDAEPRKVSVTWHTRATGTYRLSSCMTGQGVNVQDVTLTRAREVLAS